MLPVISQRRAVYPAQFNQEVVSPEELETLFEAANWAPTHRRTEPWRFKVFYSESSRTLLGEFLEATYRRTVEQPSETKAVKIAQKPLQSAAVIAICMRRDPNLSVPEWEEVAATAMAVQNLWLQASAMGIGGYWSSPALKDHMGEHIDLEEGERCLGFFYLGKYDGELEPGQRGTSGVEKVQWY